MAQSSELEQKNQHYVPQFYLRNFSNTDNKKSVSAYELKSKKHIKFASIKTTASEEYYYGEDKIIENSFKELEGIWANIIRDIIEKNKIPQLPHNLNDYLYLLLFVALSDIRAFKIGNIINKLKRGAYEHIKKFDNGMEEENIDTNHHPNFFMLNSSIENFNVFLELTPLLILNETMNDFLTSDNPCAKYNQFFVSEEFPYYGLRHGGIQIFIPLSSRICFCLYDENAYCVLNKNNEEVVTINNPMQINELNKLFLRNADRMVYFKDKSHVQHIDEILIAHKYYQHNPFINSDIPVFGVEMESINDYFDLSFFKVRQSFKNIGKRTKQKE